MTRFLTHKFHSTKKELREKRRKKFRDDDNGQNVRSVANVTPFGTTLMGAIARTTLWYGSCDSWLRLYPEVKITCGIWCAAPS
ncbi:hypothetical protein ACFYE9_11115 [Rhizobium leguminosarum]|uniref:Uncharacterized protein n=1 Tax=Rhizobium leguminosarum TaxID=384 RepID=A0ACD5F675_RHILE|nr:hypothetical protein [Rhizobium leguminosarum]